ncbi:MAG: O-methyltransferase [Cyanobacteria bacterium J06633_2]
MDTSRFEAVDQYISRLFAPEDDVLIQVQQCLDAENLPAISVSPSQGKLLMMLARLCQAQRILEIGTLGGYSTIWLARSLPIDGRLVTIELEPRYAQVAQHNIDQAGLTSRVEIRVGNALDLLPQLKTNIDTPFDMVFIDADKPPYVEYFQYALSMTRSGGLIVLDNVVRDGKLLDSESTDPKVKGVQRFTTMLANCPDVTSLILPSVGVKGYDGIAIALVNE